MKQITRQQKTGIHYIPRPGVDAGARRGLRHEHVQAHPHFRKNLILSAIACVFPNMVWAAPESGQVVAGAATITNPDANTTLINQTTDRSIINWTRFNIDSNEYVQFIQPSTGSISLNRVTGGDPSSILGSLSANGHVYLVNPNGIYFGDSAQVDVSGLVASVLDIDDADFMNGNMVFSHGAGAVAGSVINDGIINARNNGYVVLMGDYAANNGIIQAHMGKVVLASGSHVTMDVSDSSLISVTVDEATVADLAGVKNTGDIYADGGRVIMTAKVASDLIGSAVNNDGLVQAHSIVEHNGAIFLTASGGDITNTGTLDASAEAGSGVDGGGVLVHSDKNVTNVSGAVISATGDGDGNGGAVRVVAEEVMKHQSGAQIDVTSESGKGGFVELSGHGSLAIRGGVDLGSGGELLIDPGTLTITNSNNTPGFTTGGTTANGSVGKGFIENELNVGVDVTLIANNTINAAGGSLGSTTSTFTISATGNGNLNIVNGVLTPGGGTLSPSVAACSLSGVCLPGGTYGVTPSATGNINLGTVSFNINGKLTVAGGTASGNVSLGGINTGGNVSITAGGDITVAGNVAGAGTSFQAAAGNNISMNGGVGSSGNLVNAKVALNANNNVNVNSDIFLSNKTLTLAADKDVSGSGDVNINGATNAARTVKTQGAMNVSGVNFNVVGASISGYSASNAQVYVAADDGNLLTTTDNITIDIAGSMNVSAGVAQPAGTMPLSDVSVDIHAGNDIIVNNASTLNVKGGTASATSGTATSLLVNANATLRADRNITLNLTTGLNLQAGNATARVNTGVLTDNANANATIKALGNVNVTVASGNIAVTGGAATATESLSSGCSTCTAAASAKAGIEAGGQMMFSATGGSISLTNGSQSAGSPSPPSITKADAGAYLSAAEFSAVSGQDMNVAGSLINTGAAGGAAWFLNVARDINITTDLGSAGARFDDDLKLSAGNNVNIDANIFLANRNLTLIANDDAMAGGDVVLGGTDGAHIIQTTGNLTATGQNITLVGGPSIAVSLGAQSLSLVAAGNITGSSAQISAAGMYMQAGGNINLATSTLNIGSGTVSGILGDMLVLQAMQASGIPLPASSNPNAKLVAGGVLDVGTLALQSSSSYLWLVGSNTAVGSMTAPTGANVLLQYSPSDPTSNIGFEALPDTGQTVNYNNQDHVFPFPITTLVIGSSVQTGNITLGSLADVDIGSKNLVAASIGGKVDSLGNIITTGIVAQLRPASVFITPTQETISVITEDSSSQDEKRKRKKLVAQADNEEGGSEMCTGQ